MKKIIKESKHGKFEILLDDEDYNNLKLNKAKNYLKENGINV